MSIKKAFIDENVCGIYPTKMDTVSSKVKHTMMKRGVNPSDLAKQTGLSLNVVNRTLNEPPLLDGAHWKAILQLLDLEIVVRPKQG